MARVGVTIASMSEPRRPYRAFISYSHSLDGEVARALQRVLQVPIEEALKNSDFFILLASPESAASVGVGHELKWWLTNRGVESLIMVLVDGAIAWSNEKNDIDWRLTTALSRSLSKKFARVPYHADLSAFRDATDLSLENDRFMRAVYPIAARLHEKTVADLTSEARRNQRIKIRAAIATAVIFAGLSAVALWGMSSAAVSEERARQAMRKALVVARFINFDADRSLKPIAGAAAVREALLESSAELIDELQKEIDENDVELLRQKMVTATQRADLAQSHGDIETARILLEEVHALAVRLVRADPRNELWQSDLVTSYLKQTELYLKLVETDAAERAALEGLRLSRELAAPNSTSFAAQINLAQALMLRAEVLKVRGLEAEARRTLEEAADVATAYLKIDPANLRMKRQRMSAAGRLGSMAIGAKDVDVGRKWLKIAGSIARELVQREPNNDQWKIDLSIQLYSSALSFVEVGDVAQAREHLQESLEIARALSAIDSADARWQSRLCAPLEQLGLLEFNAGNLPAAQRYLSECVEIGSALMDRDPTNADNRDTLFECRRHLGRVFLAEGRPADARRELEKVIDGARAILAADPENMPWLRGLSIGLSELAEVARLERNHDEARRLLDDDISIAKRLVGRNPDNAEYQRDLVISLLKLGDLERSEKNYSQAAQHCDEALNIARAISKKNPANLVLRREISTALQEAAEVAMEAENIIRANLLLDEGLANMKELVAREPNHPAWHRDLLMATSRIMRYALAAHDMSRARTAFNSAKAQLAKIDANRWFQEDGGVEFVRERLYLAAAALGGGAD